MTLRNVNGCIILIKPSQHVQHVISNDLVYKQLF